MGGQTMERDLSGVKLGKGSAKVALATTGKANCNPAQALEASAYPLLARGDRCPNLSFGGSEARMPEGHPVKRNNGVLRQGTGGPPDTPPLARTTHQGGGRSGDRRGRWARPRVAGKEPRRVFPFRRAE